MYAGLRSTSLISQSRGLDVLGGRRCDIVHFVVLQVLSVGLIAMTLLEVRGGYLFLGVGICGISFLEVGDSVIRICIIFIQVWGLHAVCRCLP